MGFKKLGVSAPDVLTSRPCDLVGEATANLPPCGALWFDEWQLIVPGVFTQSRQGSIFSVHRYKAEEFSIGTQEPSLRLRGLASGES